MHATLLKLLESDFPAITRNTVNTIQVNLGYKCNQTCLHCHVNAGPNRTEMMTDDVLEKVVDLLQHPTITTIDLTGGAPEMHPGFRNLVTRARSLEKKVIDRCNLTILFEEDQQDLADFLANNGVEIVASMPCYSPENVNQQRGSGVFDKSIAALQLLNRLGYGKSDTNLSLHLVYNPQGPTLPPDQHKLEQDYKRVLFEKFGVVFNQLFTITNMPIKRFGSTLISKGTFDNYLSLLKNHFKSVNLEHVMCKSLISIDWQGHVFDCDFNQQLNMPIKNRNKALHLNDLDVSILSHHKIETADHCFGCTAGNGSSCGGALGKSTQSKRPN